MQYRRVSVWSIFSCDTKSQAKLYVLQTTIWGRFSQRTHVRHDFRSRLLQHDESVLEHQLLIIQAMTLTVCQLHLAPTRLKHSFTFNVYGTFRHGQMYDLCQHNTKETLLIWQILYINDTLEGRLFAEMDRTTRQSNMMSLYEDLFLERWSRDKQQYGAVS